jgi:hypothetical protein
VGAVRLYRPEKVEQVTYLPQERSDLQADFYEVDRWHRNTAQRIFSEMFKALWEMPVESVFDGSFFDGPTNEGET